jgi:hypothetical protein
MRFHRTPIARGTAICSTPEAVGAANHATILRDKQQSAAARKSLSYSLPGKPRRSQKEAGLYFRVQ